MSILLPHDIAWTPATWVGRGLFRNMLELGGLPPKLEADLQFALDAATYTLDYSEATVEDLQVLRPLVQAVLERVIARGPNAMQLPEFHPGYVRWLSTLVEQLDGLIGSGSEPG